MSASSMSANDVAKTIAAAVVSKVPYAGGLLAGLIDAFWPSTPGPTLWQQVEQQVQNLISQDLAKYNLQQLQDTLQGLQNQVSDYVQLTDPTQKQIALQAIDEVIVSNAPKFMNGDPGTNFSCFWGMALLHLSVRRELVQVFGSSGNAALLADSVVAYCAYGHTGLSRIYNTRLGQLQFSSSSDNVEGKNSKWRVYANLNDTSDNTELFIYSQIFNAPNWPIAQAASYVNSQLPIHWNDIQDPLQTQLNALLHVIQTMQAANPYSETQGLAQLQQLMAPSDYQAYVQSYYPSTSIYNTPDTTEPAQLTPTAPSVNWQAPGQA
ncbi:MAG: hypothetical protein JNN30_07025 [Rhodanobacteraceae bacterium]|nr:hypothetical protein [Rhodanobacteraceae bacterium]